MDRSVGMNSQGVKGTVCRLICLYVVEDRLHLDGIEAICFWPMNDTRFRREYAAHPSGLSALKRWRKANQTRCVFWGDGPFGVERT